MEKKERVKYTFFSEGLPTDFVDEIHDGIDDREGKEHDREADECEYNTLTGLFIFALVAVCREEVYSREDDTADSHERPEEDNIIRDADDFTFDAAGDRVVAESHWHPEDRKATGRGVHGLGGFTSVECGWEAHPVRIVGTGGYCIGDEETANNISDRYKKDTEDTKRDEAGHNE